MYKKKQSFFFYKVKKAVSFYVVKRKNKKNKIMQQIRITLKSFDPQCLSNAMKHISYIANVLEINAFKKINLPKKIKKITVLRSPHIDKKSREQFELRHNKSVFIFNVEKKSRANLFIECLKNTQLSGIEFLIDIRYASFL